MTEMPHWDGVRIQHLRAQVEAMEEFIFDYGLADAWRDARAALMAQPCAVCGVPSNHFGRPHGEITGDGRTRPKPAPNLSARESLAAELAALDSERDSDGQAVGMTLGEQSMRAARRAKRRREIRRELDQQ